jgi:3-phenylpropionate/cinnamic acid dioxygenase small subunit
MRAERGPLAEGAASTSNTELHFALTTLNTEYAHALDNERYDDWLELFIEDCLYRVVPRENHVLDLPIALIHCESKGMLRDRVQAARDSTMAEPRTIRHFVTNIRVLEANGDAIRAEANVLIVQTMINRMTEIVLSGFYLDRLVRRDGRLLFRERLCIYDSLLIPTSLVAPV